MDIVYSVIGEQIHLPFYVSGVGIADPEYHIFRENGLISHQILFTASGTGCLEIDGKSYEMPEGSLFYVKPGVVHEYYPKEEGKWKTCWVVFRGEMLDALMENMGYGTYYIGTLADLKYTYALFHKILDAAKEPCHGAENSSKVLYEYILHIRRVILGLEEQASDFLRLERALERMGNYYYEDISLQELADLSNISKQHFCRLFRQKIGIRPMEYLAKKRVAQAKVLLEQTELTIQEIAKRVGYEDFNYFGIVFKKHEGISPSQYRKRI